MAFQASFDLESVGYFIPMEVIQRFLHDIEDGRYDGYPELGVITSNLTSAAARAYAGLHEGETGVRVDSVFAGASAGGHLQPGDVILSVGGRSVANDGSVADGVGRIPFGLLVDRHQIGETIDLRVLRDGQRIDLDAIPLRGLPAAENQGHIYDRRPRYYVYAGLVFVTLNREMMKTYGDQWRSDANKALLHEFLVRPAMDDNYFVQERVVLLRRLADPVNAEMAWFRNQVVQRVNGREITSLEVLVEALESHDGEFQVIEFAHYRRLGVVDRRRAEQAHEAILDRYGIQEDRHL